MATWGFLIPVGKSQLKAAEYGCARTTNKIPSFNKALA